MGGGQPAQADWPDGLQVNAIADADLQAGFNTGRYIDNLSRLVLLMMVAMLVLILVLVFGVVFVLVFVRTMATALGML